MVEYPRALRRAHQVVLFHPDDARAFVAERIEQATAAGLDREVAEWRRIGHFVERLLDVIPEARSTPAARHRHPPPRYRRIRAPRAP